jgi:hypothetical protein
VRRSAVADVPGYVVQKAKDNPPEQEEFAHGDVYGNG